jgi:hypothetical protein
MWFSAGEGSRLTLLRDHRGFLVVSDIPPDVDVSSVAFTADESDGVPGDEATHEAIFKDIDAILSRLDDGIAAERSAMHVLLERVAGHRG